MRVLHVYISSCFIYVTRYIIMYVQRKVKRATLFFMYTYIYISTHRNN